MTVKVKFCRRRPRMVTFNSYAEFIEYTKLFRYGNRNMPQTLWLEYIEGDMDELMALK